MIRWKREKIAHFFLHFLQGGIVLLKKLLSALLAILLVCGILPSFALAADVFDPRPEGKIPGGVNEMVETVWDSETHEFTVTIKSEITKLEWALLYQNCRNEAGTKLLLDYEANIPEDTADCIFCIPSDGYTFGEFQNDYQSKENYIDGTPGFSCFSLEGDDKLTDRVSIAECVWSSDSITIIPREESYEIYFAWLDEDGHVISYSNIIYTFVSEASEVVFSKDELLSEHRCNLEYSDFFENWNEEEMITSFGPDKAGVSVNVLYPGDADFGDSIECKFVDGILEITLHEMSPELLKAAYDIPSDNYGELRLKFEITLPEDTENMMVNQGNYHFSEEKELLDELGELTIINDNKAYGFMTIGRLVKDGSVVTYFPEKDSGLFGCFVGYYDGNEIHQRALMMYVTSAKDSHSVSFINPFSVTPVDPSQIEVDKTYNSILSGQNNGEPNYDPKTGTLTYRYLGEGETPEKIAADFGVVGKDDGGIIPEHGGIATSTTIHAPQGYVLCGVFDRDGNFFSVGNDTALTIMCDFGEDGNIVNQNIQYTIVWQKEADQNLLYQKINITNDFGKPFPYYDIYLDVPDQNHIQFYSKKLGVVTVRQLAEYGIHVNLENGFIHTTLDRGAKLNEVGNVLAFILPPENAVYCKTNCMGGDMGMPRYSQRDADNLRDLFDTIDFESIRTGDDFYRMDCYPVCIPNKATIETSDGNSITIWYTKMITVESFVVEWYDAEKKLIRGNYLYGTMDDLAFVQETDSIKEDEIDGSIEFPTLIQANGNSQNRKLQSKINPQSSENSTLIELRALWENDPDEVKQIFIPREYLNYDGEWGEENVNFTITHYEGIEDLAELEEAAKNGKGVEALCEFNEYGLYIYTKSFSPFLIEWEFIDPEEPENPGWKPWKPSKRNSSSRSSDDEKIILDGKDTDSGETNPDTGAFVPEKPVELLAAGMILSFAIMALSKNK